MSEDLLDSRAEIHVESYCIRPTGWWDITETYGRPFDYYSVIVQRTRSGDAWVIRRGSLHYSDGRFSGGRAERFALDDALEVARHLVATATDPAGRTFVEVAAELTRKADDQ